MDGHARPIRRLPDPPPPSLPLQTITKPLDQPLHHSLYVPRVRLTLDRRQLDVLLRPPLPPRLHILSPLRDPIGLQCSLLFLPQFPKVHTFHPQYPSPPH